MMNAIQAPYLQSHRSSSRSLHHRGHRSSTKVELHCQYCERRFTKSYNLLIHERSHAVADEWYYCDICGKGFSKQWGLSQHRSQHSPSGSSSSSSSSSGSSSP